MKNNLLVILALASLTAHAGSGMPDTVFLEELTWTEVRDALAAGTRNIIIPTAGTEQNGPHVVLGKHKFRMNAGADRIARKLGNTLVAPIVTFVPEGDIDPPSGHMRYPGTITTPEPIYRGILEYTARSLKAHGFINIILIGDSGGNQEGMMAVAEMLNEEWRDVEARVLFVSDWYTSTAFREWLKDRGFTENEIGRHAGLSDTASLMAVAPQHVRVDKMIDGQAKDVDGVSGDPSKASIELGNVGMDFLVDAALRQLEQMMDDS